ncbi:CDP-glycerol glycerophosphotransferase family protein [Morganella morganii]|uniref:CDP-glycerol glycerophosphotransferase family protein n=1 Tax=Morganella morganii TaxID=582 RepID=UPI000F818A04|nr:CDP-glycerol glycerophosphotransferase family protein [Morganella morganii]MBT0334539.1 CDP-glycerol glycerophosphotransferase family protein [Morganella morganii subsp. morganii]MBT0403345.1 CDP-glycerol glycerophosphotransferase family protein [Morganella morganii subsp. morganii]RTY31246.1 hypothetical protein EKS33_11095 [Morganella morganii subsp. morganii]UEO57165.1 teichoic acid poly(glycerol phosphate) polymerase transaminase [Morganella morganii]HEI8863935.1 CDP-glycerol glyceropho
MKLKKTLIKIVSILLGYITLVFSYFTLRSNKIWIIGSLKQFNCNSKYFYIFFNEEKEKHKDIKLIWISRDKKTIELMKKKGLNDTAYIWSLKGIYYLFRAKIYITSYPVDESLCIWTMGTAKYINLWHGVGLKYHRFMQTDKKSYFYFHQKITKILLRPFLINFYKKFDLFISTSPTMTELFRKSFRISKDRIYNAIYPRCEFIIKDKGSILSIIKKYDINNSLDTIQTLKKYSSTYLYMPTWRDNTPDFLHQTGINFSELNNYLLQKNQLFIIKLHPRTPIPSDIKNNLSNIIILNNVIDIYSILPYINTLITDYSSIYYDSLLLPNVNKILFPFDIKTYEKNNRNLALPFDSCIAHPIVYTYEQLLHMMENYSALYISDKDNEDRVKGIFWETKKNTIDIIESIKKL